MSYPMIEIGDLMLKRNGSVDPSKFPDETFELHSIPAFDKGTPDIVKGSEIGSSKQLVQENDVMISKIVPHIRRASVVCQKGDYRQIASGEWIIFRSDKIYPDYLKHVLISDAFNKQFMATVSGVGGSLLRARPAFVAKIKIALPPLPEQRRIASILDQADELRQKRQQAIEKLDQLLQATFIDMFGDPVSNPKGWELVKVGEVVNEFIGGKNIECPDESDSDYKILKVSAVTSKIYKPNESKFAPKTFTPNPLAIVKKGDLLFSRANTTELVAATAYVWETPENIVLPDKLWKFSISDESKVNKLYLWDLFKNIEFRNELSKLSSGTSGSMKNISKGKLNELKMPLPPKELQDKFADFSTKLWVQIKTFKQSSDNLDTLFKSLQNRAFSGNL